MSIYRDIFLMQQTYATLFSLSNKLQVKGDKFYDKLTVRQYMAMIAIAHLPEDETTLNNIAKKLGTTKQSVKQLITILEDKGYVSIIPSQKDKRAVNVKFTEAAKQVLVESSERGLYFLIEIFRNFTSEEMETLWSMLKKLYRFDGEEQDGFEEEADMIIGEEKDELQQKAFKEFEKLRNKSRKSNKGDL